MGEVVGFPDGHGVGLGWRKPSRGMDKASGLALLAGWLCHCGCISLLVVR